MEYVIDFGDGTGMFETFAMPGKSQPRGEPKHVRLILPDDKKRPWTSIWTVWV